MRRSSIFVAIFLVLGGALMLVRNLFNLHFSVFSVLFALALILLGLYFLAGRGKGHVSYGNDGKPLYSQAGEQSLFFSQRYIQGASNTGKYTICFSQATISLPDDAPALVEVESIFSDTVVLVPKNRAVDVRVSAVFGMAYAPDNVAQGFGDHSAVYGTGEPLELRCSAVFGGVRVVEDKNER